KDFFMLVISGIRFDWVRDFLLREWFCPLSEAGWYPAFGVAGVGIVGVAAALEPNLGGAGESDVVVGFSAKPSHGEGAEFHVVDRSVLVRVGWMGDEIRIRRLLARRFGGRW